ncbi:MAG TPA: signal peptidase I [Patescibacteria group bacterium]|nr:signal peptidase I [Patescibacteria group bacterium]
MPKLRSLDLGSDPITTIKPRSQHGFANGGYDNPLMLCHTGVSMMPTLCEQDLLEVQLCNDLSVRVGDVIVFRMPGQRTITVHRIIGIKPDGIRTKGDNNDYEDPCLLKPDDVVGCVVAAWRGHLRRKITRGKTGLMEIEFARLLRIIDRRVCTLLYPLYVLPARAGIIQRLLPVPLRPRVVAFRSGGRQRLHLLLGQHCIGHYEENGGCWTIRRPFRLFVDERLLPCHRDFMDS